MELKPTGSLIEICTLAAVSHGDRHASELLREIVSVADVTRGELDEALGRLASQGFLESYEWPSEAGTQRYYRLTDLGGCLLERSLADWEDYLRRVDRFLRPAADRSRAV